MPGVIPIEYCQYCREHVPPGHQCPFAPPPCPTEAGHPCGICEACIAAQETALLGSPPDLDHPA